MSATEQSIGRLTDSGDGGGAPAAAPSVSVRTTATRLWRLSRGRRTPLFVAIASASLAALFSLAPYLAVALTFVVLFKPSPDPHLLLVVGIAGIVAVLIEKVLFATATAISHTVAFDIQRAIRLDLAQKLQRVPLGFFDETSKGEIRTVLVDDIETIEDAVAHLVPEASAAVIAPLIVIVAMTMIDWRLALLLLCPIILGSMMLDRMMTIGKGPTRDYFALVDKVSHVSAELVDSLPTVRAFNQDGQAIGRARDTFRELTRFTRRWVELAVAPGATAQVMLSSHLLFSGPAGLMMASAGLISLPMLAVFLAVAYGFGDLFSALHGISYRLTMQARILDRIDALERAVEFPVTKDAVTPRDASVVFEHVNFAYGTREVLSDVSFTVRPGKCLALVGPSGSGKSTVARLIARFHDVNAGRVLIGDADIKHVAPDLLNRSVSFVFQDVFLLSGTIADNIRLGDPDASDDDVIAAARAAQVHGFIISDLPDSYQTVVGERGLGLSGGERQRISIARALLKNAPILVLDEATAFADAENEALIQSAIAILAEGRTLIVIAHRLHTIMQADEILVLDGGRIVERGSHEPLLKAQGLYSRMWEAQAGAAHTKRAEREAAL